MLVVRMHQMGIAKMVQPICVGGRESAVYLEYGDAEDEYERKDVEKYSQFDDKAVFEKFIAPLWKAYNEMSTRTPLTDWYDTISGNEVGFQNRTVQGGLYMKMLADAWKK